VSTAIARRDQLDQAVSFTHRVVRHDSILDAMSAPRADGYGEHIKDFLAFAEEHGPVDIELVRDYYRGSPSRSWGGASRRTRCGIPSRLGRPGGRTRYRAVSTYLGRSSTAITMNYYVHEQLEDDELLDPEDGE
jgi:hypothetical protein